MSPDAVKRHDKEVFGCHGKAKFRANAAKKWAHMQHNGVRPYRCRFCGWFHIGNSIQPNRGTGTKNASHSRRNNRQQPMEIES